MTDGMLSSPDTRIAAALAGALYYQQTDDHVRVMAYALDAYRAAREIGDIEAWRCSLLLLRETEAKLVR